MCWRTTPFLHSYIQILMHRNILMRKFGLLQCSIVPGKFYATFENSLSICHCQRCQLSPQVSGQNRCILLVPLGSVYIPKESGIKSTLLCLQCIVVSDATTEEIFLQLLQPFAHSNLDPLRVHASLHVLPESVVQSLRHLFSVFALFAQASQHQPNVQRRQRKLRPEVLLQLQRCINFFIHRLRHHLCVHFFSSTYKLALSAIEACHSKGQSLVGGELVQIGTIILHLQGGRLAGKCTARRILRYSGATCVSNKSVAQIFYASNAVQVG
mmetsp:Transcript_13722/g.26314  ORF Transcript_13722/g.26314 Transcript_13722/m.26314 type:complete len:269 (+) Transcript_13722:336-1142(+)